MATIPLSGTMAPLVYAPGTPSDFVQMPAPATGKGGAVDTINYGGTYTYDAPVPLTQIYTPTTFAPQYFDNTGVIVDPTLLAAQEILARPPRTRGALTPGGSGDSVSASNAPVYPAYQSAYPDAFVPVGFHSGVGDPGPGPVDMPTPVGGQGASGLVDSSGNFVGGLGQGISTGQQNLGFALMDYGQTAGGLLPGGGLANLIGTSIIDNQIDAISGSMDALESGGSQPGVVSVSDAQGNVATFSTPGSVALSDATNFGGIGTSIGIGDTGSVAVGGGGVADTGMVSVDGQTVSNAATIAAQDAANFGPSTDGGGGGDGSGKIICTAMNHAYGFGSYRNAIWLKYSAQHMTKAHEVGYHALFLPLVKYAFHSGDGLGNQVVRRVLEHGTRRRTADLRAEMRGTKRDALGRFYRLIFEPVCYLVGKAKGY